METIEIGDFLVSLEYTHSGARVTGMVEGNYFSELFIGQESREELLMAIEESIKTFCSQFIVEQTV
ncbi:MAG: hypothetical protein F6K65_22275 [Moorea sp. SIO3C2]|nr:hypothetical protein [Moorena sp. SIO3C2]